MAQRKHPTMLLSELDARPTGFDGFSLNASGIAYVAKTGTTARHKPQPMNDDELKHWSQSLADPSAFPDMDPVARLVARRLLATVEKRTKERDELLSRVDELESVPHVCAAAMCGSFAEDGSAWCAEHRRHIRDCGGEA